MIPSPSRRGFLRGVAAAAAGAGAFSAPAVGRARRPPNETLRIGVIGTSGRALDNIKGVESEEIVAVCDVDGLLLGKARERFPQADAFDDFRRLLDLDRVDAVVISTPDHTHAPAAAMALRRGKHVYCEKPLTHTVREARTLAELSSKARVATQMGTQIHATDNYRRVVELVRAGAIGPVRTCHVWCGKSWSGGDRPAETPPVPPGLRWDLWLGPAPERPYHPTYQPANWRRWWDFGNGTLGDMACHFMDLPFWALGLRHPTSIAADGPPPHPETAPEWLSVRWEFPARDGSPPVSLTWTDGDRPPPIPAEVRFPDWPSGVLFVGDAGMLLADYNRRVLLPEVRFRDFAAPAPTIPASIGHHAEWIAACKSGSPTSCPFGNAGALTESVLLGVVAYRAGGPIRWDAGPMRLSGPAGADALLHREYRRGWAL